MGLQASGPLLHPNLSFLAGTVRALARDGGPLWRRRDGIKGPAVVGGG